MKKETARALTPQPGGHQFVFYGDCCSGLSGGPFESNFSRVNAALQNLHPEPDFIIFLGDHIMGTYAEKQSFEEQWNYWLGEEMSWHDADRIPIYHCTSNHDTPDADSERIWRQVFPDIPRNGPPGQDGLSYWLRRGDFLLVMVNTSYSGLGGPGHVECSWLDATLEAHADARFKIVAGHHPVFPV
ncbi:MAG: metallophosphoesterase, partial [Lentisphaeria bacterium]|nr:metallophosphoesterase [Lentisphaeria bacterium]NQZ68626.1 metallophosphoesterase [Lentisphaeria bacterium]